MAGLVGYASSDDASDDEIPQKVIVGSSKQDGAHAPEPSAHEAQGIAEKMESSDHVTLQIPDEPREPEIKLMPISQSAIPLGPSLPPIDLSVTKALMTVDLENESQEPTSPYSTNRSLIHELTLPTVPNLDIPPSPPGSPQPGANEKFDQFLELKKKGTHFNSKLEQSVALKNPGLMEKLMEFVGIDDEDQYGTTLPSDLWDPRGLPTFAFKDRLKKTREKVVKAKESEKMSGNRGAVEFIPAVSNTPFTTKGISLQGSGGLSTKGDRKKKDGR